MQASNSTLLQALLRMWENITSDRHSWAGRSLRASDAECILKAIFLYLMSKAPLKMDIVCLEIVWKHARGEYFDTK